MKEQKKGFTIVEISLAMTFLAILLVSIATLIMRITNIYQKGLAMRAINATGTEIIEDISRTISGASYLVDIHSDDVNMGGNGFMEYDNNYSFIDKYYYTYTEYGAEVYNGSSVNVQYYGILCTGDYSYIWNTARAIQDPPKDVSTYVTVNGKKVKFVRVYDRGQKQCDPDNRGDYGDASDDGFMYQVKKGNSVIALNFPDADDVVDLINDDELDLALYEFNIIPATQSAVTRQTFLSGNFILATRQGGVNINANGDYCRGEDNEFSEEYDSSMFNYCAVNKFTFSARTGGHSDKEG